MTPENYREAVNWLNENMRTLARRRLSALHIDGWKATPRAPNTYEALQSHGDRARRECTALPVYDGGCENTIYGNPSTNHAFRAWHDGCHLAAEAPFTPQGEEDTMHLQWQDVSALMDAQYKGAEGVIARYYNVCTILEAEVMGQVSYFEAHGVFPEHQSAFVYSRCVTAQRYA